VITIPEETTIMANLRYLSKKGELLPPIIPKLLTQKEVAAMLSLSFGNFRKLEKEGSFPFKRKMVGSAVRYRNLDVIKYILADGENIAEIDPLLE